MSTFRPASNSGDTTHPLRYTVAEPVKTMRLDPVSHRPTYIEPRKLPAEYTRGGVQASLALDTQLNSHHGNGRGGASEFSFLYGPNVDTERYFNEINARNLEHTKAIHSTPFLDVQAIEKENPVYGDYIWDDERQTYVIFGSSQSAKNPYQEKDAMPMIRRQMRQEARKAQSRLQPVEM